MTPTTVAGGSRAPGSSPFLTGDAEFLLVDVERFQGPLDLLLHLIRTQDIDVFDIPIARITRQFLDAIKTIDPDGLDHAGEFLEMAATLVRIKAQMLLPRHGEDEDEDPRAELVRRLLEYEQIREISQRLAAAELERSRRASKGFVPSRPRPSVEDQPLETTWDEVFGAALGVELPDPRDPSHRVLVRPVAMSDKVSLILRRLSEVAEIEFSRLLTDVGGVEAKMHGVMTLLASLELTRRRQVMMRQISPFSDLWLYRREGEDEDEAPWTEDGEGAVGAGMEPGGGKDVEDAGDVYQDAEDLYEDAEDVYEDAEGVYEDPEMEHDVDDEQDREST
ncbi:MAG TPA: segregation/condensation protein A [Longimicrobiales bacterium]|nr:segregation/condensation protein A [Longimicrobiales bacterium]